MWEPVNELKVEEEEVNNKNLLRLISSSSPTILNYAGDLAVRKGNERSARSYQRVHTVSFSFMKSLSSNKHEGSSRRKRTC